MPRYIDADALMADIESTIASSGCVNHEREILDCIEYAPTIDAVPVEPRLLKIIDAYRALPTTYGTLVLAVAETQRCCIKGKWYNLLDLQRLAEENASVVRGEWKLYGNDDDSGMSYWCTACNFQLSEDLFYSGYKNGKWIENGVFKYCPNCGAKMDKEDET